MLTPVGSPRLEAVALHVALVVTLDARLRGPQVTLDVVLVAALGAGLRCPQVALDVVVGVGAGGAGLRCPQVALDVAFGFGVLLVGHGSSCGSGAGAPTRSEEHTS